MACSSGCPTKNHRSWGACVRAKALQVQDVEAHKYNSGINRQLDEYRKARYDGLQPDSVYAKDVDAARRITDATGVPYRGDA